MNALPLLALASLLTRSVFAAPALDMSAEQFRASFWAAESAPSERLLGSWRAVAMGYFHEERVCSSHPGLPLQTAVVLAAGPGGVGIVETASEPGSAHPVQLIPDGAAVRLPRKKIEVPLPCRGVAGAACGAIVDSSEALICRLSSADQLLCLISYRDQPRPFCRLASGSDCVWGLPPVTDGMEFGLYRVYERQSD